MMDYFKTITDHLGGAGWEGFVALWEFYVGLSAVERREFESNLKFIFNNQRLYSRQVVDDAIMFLDTIEDCANAGWLD